MPRPRQFDEAAALDSAMRLFWKHGYEGTSLTALTEAMGINKPSLYATFGDKETLFRRTLDHYVHGPGAPIAAAMELPTARATIEAILEFYAVVASDASRPAGCLLVNGAMSCSPEAADIRDALATYRTWCVETLAKRFDRAKRAGELPPGVSALSLSRFYWSVLHGMAISASDGATTPQLRQTAALALAAWPG